MRSPCPDNRIYAYEYDEEQTRLGSPFAVDVYHIRQLAIYFKLGLGNVEAVHDYFARKTILGSYLCIAGVERVLKYLYNFRFRCEDIEKFKLSFPDLADEAFIRYLEDFRFRGDVWAMPEGQLCFGQNEPIIKIKSNWLEGWFMETIVMDNMNGSTGFATNATHFVQSARGLPVVDFGMRRASGDGAKISPTRSVYIGGIDATSNVEAFINLGIPNSGTMSHEAIQVSMLIYGSEEKAFEMYIEEAIKQDNKLVLLVDTTNDIEQGAKNAIRALQKVSAKLGKKIKADAFRIDSGDLYEEAKKIRALDPEKEWFDGIFLTNDLGPEEIARILELDKDGIITGFGAGTKLLNLLEVVGGVYKVSAIKFDGVWNDTLKISGSADKTTLPGDKTVYRRFDENGMMAEDIICLASEDRPEGRCIELLQKMMENGKIIINPISLQDIRLFSMSRRAKLPDKFRKYRGKEVFPVRISPALDKLRAEEVIKMEASCRR